jgi:hypothetical protein
MSKARAALLCLALAGLSACRPGPAPPPRPTAGDSTSARGTAMPAMSLTLALEKHTPELLAIPGVNGTGEGLERGVPVFVVFVQKLTPELEARLPGTIEGHPVVVREIGRVLPYRHP